MAWYNFFRRSKKEELPPPDSYASTIPNATKAWQSVVKQIENQGSTAELLLIKNTLEKTIRAPATSVGLPDVGFKGVRQQLFQRFNLVDLYAVAHNNSVIKTATGSLKQEVFRRGMKWDPAFAFRDRITDIDYTLDDLKELEERDPEKFLEIKYRLEEPDMDQRTRFEQFIQKVNIYGQSLMSLLHTIEDDLNIADDGFIFMSSEYYLGWSGEKEIIRRRVKQMFRLDPIFVEFDTDQENRPGFAHHICLAHRDDLLVIPKDERWEYEWRGKCPQCGHTTFPVLYRYSPYKGTFGVRSGLSGPDARAMYIVEGEMIHASKFSPSELYGYSPVLSIYEKALSLIGMDRYLYDYFFERQVPQGVVTTVTDNPDDLETRKEQMLSAVLNDPHYIPWLAVSSKTGQGKTEFVRFAYSLDELQFLPVQEHIERSVSSLYGVPGLFMGYEDGVGGLNNESQQITRLSRGAQLSQSVYNTDILPVILNAFNITDWTLTLEVAEEQTEQFKLDMKQQNAQWASTMVSMGFGARYDQDTDEFEIYGEVQSQSEQAQQWGGDEMMGGSPDGGNPMESVEGLSEESGGEGDDAISSLEDWVEDGDDIEGVRLSDYGY